MRARLVERLGLSAAAVSETVGRRVNQGFVELDGERHLTLTTKGRFQVRAAFPGAIRSPRLWVRVP